MGSKKFIAEAMRKYLNESRGDMNLIDKILDKINRDGIHSLSIDERKYLNQHSKNAVDYDLENWLNNGSDETFDDNGNKLLYDEFKDEEDILNNRKKLIRVISKILNKKPFTNNADWGGGYVWNVKGNNNFEGVFIYLGDDELVLLKRTSNESDEYETEILRTITNNIELNRVFLLIKKS